MEKFLGEIDNFLFDCDGVLWRGNDAVTGAEEVIKRLSGQGKKMVFVSNNSTKSSEGYVKKFAQVLNTKITVDDVVSSSVAAAYYLKHHAKGKVFVIGEDGILDEFKKSGLKYSTYADYFPSGSNTPNAPYKLIKNDLEVPIVEDAEVTDVLVGLDRHFSYAKIAQAHHFIRYGKAKFYATNTDTTFPLGTLMFPGTGTLVQCVAACVADIMSPQVFGKPHKLMMDMIMEKFGFDPRRTCMVGDRLDTDIAFGKNSNLRTLLVLSGVCSQSDADNCSPDAKPDMIASGVCDLLPYLAR